MIIATSSFSPPTDAFTSPLMHLLFTMSHKRRAGLQAKDDDDDGGRSDDDDDDGINDNDEHHRDDQ